MRIKGRIGPPVYFLLACGQSSDVSKMPRTKLNLIKKVVNNVINKHSENGNIFDRKDNHKK
ncbi:hypothetical protein HZS_6890 [Henneguya salminicola]|nr:hypothetical protein HZS_6890 [Henneguya salminicola]